MASSTSSSSARPTSAATRSSQADASRAPTCGRAAPRLTISLTSARTCAGQRASSTTTSWAASSARGTAATWARAMAGRARRSSSGTASRAKLSAAPPASPCSRPPSAPTTASAASRTRPTTRPPARGAAAPPRSTSIRPPRTRSTHSTRRSSLSATPPPPPPPLRPFSRAASSDEKPPYLLPELPKPCEPEPKPCIFCAETPPYLPRFERALSRSSLSRGRSLSSSQICRDFSRTLIPWSTPASEYWKSPSVRSWYMWSRASSTERSEPLRMRYSRRVIALYTTRQFGPFSPMRFHTPAMTTG
mmetsp:Transcript_45620/g.120236  ORF Transcript_45620/g.120236 Transcript_45620/m.120236 type:complete len:304 (+) Transcript_45620:1195-2106(+)